MNLGEIKKSAQRILGDESGALFEPDDFIRWINDAEIDIARKTEVLQDFTTLDVVADQIEYDLPTDFLKFVKVTYDGRTLSQTTLQEIDSLNPSRDSDNFRDISFKYYLWGNRLWLYPKPPNDIAGGLIMFYVFRPPALLDDTDIPAIPVQMHKSLVDYCVAQGRDLNEELEGSALSMRRYEDGVMLSRDETKDRNMESYPAIRALPGDMG